MSWSAHATVDWPEVPEVLVVGVLSGADRGYFRRSQWWVRW